MASSASASTPSSTMIGRMKKEMDILLNEPPHGICAWMKEDQIDQLEAQITGPEGSPFEKGVFHLELVIPTSYPFQPPKVRFITPIYHPNIDNAGRICLDTLKMRPKGSWLPSVNLSTLLTTIRILMAEPNADDGLMLEITDEYKQNFPLFTQKAKEHTRKYAIKDELSGSSSSTTLTSTASSHATSAESTAAGDKTKVRDQNSTKMEQHRSSSDDDDCRSEDDNEEDESESEQEMSRCKKKRLF